MSGSVKLFTCIDITSKTETYGVSESVELCANIDTARPQGAVEYAFIKTLELQEFSGQFAQIDFLHQTLIKLWSRDIMICEILRKWTPTPPGLEFWKTNADSTLQAPEKERNNN